MKKSLSTEKSDHSVVFFDGVCNLCNGFVDFLIRRDPNDRLRFAPLQGETAKKLVPAAWREELSSVVLWQDGRCSRESAAAVRALATLGGVWKLALVFLVVPALLRDFIYRGIARNRYRWFGQRETCRLPSPEERERFLD